MPEPMNDLERLTDLITGALERLGASATGREIAEWSALVHSCMSGHGRRFHDMEHVFKIAATVDPIEQLAAVFHDTVYYQIDGGLPDAVKNRIGFALGEVDSAGVLHALPDDELATLVAAIFGFTPDPGMSTSSGLNEILSALLALRCLGETSSLAQSAAICACIEATIPFRTSTTSSTAEALFERLSRANQTFDLGMSDEQLVTAIHRAVDLANRDVGNFARADIIAFLDDTWELLPESNDALRSASNYTVTEYRIALSGMRQFFVKLDAERIFRAFRDRPDRKTIADWTRQARRNIQLSLRYLSTKVVTAWLLQFIAELTGGDAPIALFMGTLQRDSDGPVTVPQHTRRLEALLPDTPPETADDVHDDVLALLTVGRARDSGFDLRHAPLTAFLYRAMGDAAIGRVLLDLDSNKPDDRSDDPSDGGFDDMERLTWITSLPDGTVDIIVAACKTLVTERDAVIGALEESLRVARARRDHL